MTIPRIIISATSSGSGKTIITCGIIEILKNMGLKICAYKTGPDYIDPGYLKKFSQCEVFNLDTWLMNKNLTLKLFYETSKNKDIAIIEGAMGLYDGGENSTAEIAKLLNAPVILVINAQSSAESVAATALGFIKYDENVNISGVILNKIGSDSHSKIIQKALLEHNIKFLGSVKRNDEKLKFPERHLGLVPMNEIENIKNFKNIINSEININEILKISKQNSHINNENIIQTKNLFITNKIIRIAIAKDEAFSFYYPESFEILKNFGCELKFFSPVHDKDLPDCDGYIFGGGFPETFAKELSENFLIKEKIFKAFINNRIFFAECGGLMYLCNSIKDFHGKEFKMLGIIPSSCEMTKRPVLGYVEVESLKDNIICNNGKKFRGHEFHFSRIKPENEKIFNTFKITRKSTGNSWLGGYSNENILASYVHINFWGNKDIVENFLFFCNKKQPLFQGLY